MKKSFTQEYGPAPVARGDRVVVREQGIDPWLGTVQTVKPSSVSGWWADIERDAAFTWAINLTSTDVEVIKSEEE